MAVTSTSVCGIVAAKSARSIICYRTNGEIISVEPTVSFSAISGGQNFFCGLRSGGYAFLCWNTFNSSNNSSFSNPQRVYFNTTVLLQNLAVGGNHICGIVNDTANVNGTGIVKCWRGDGNISNQTPADGDQFESISSGYGFSCGILINGHRIRCWGNNPIAREIESDFGNMSMASIAAGGFHLCGVNSTGFLVCKGDNSSGQLDVPVNSALEYYQLALGANYSCALRRNGTVVCWGGRGLYSVNGTVGIFFESIVSGSNFTCGLTTWNFSIMCWGPGWPNVDNSGVQVLPFTDQILHGRFNVSNPFPSPAPPPLLPLVPPPSILPSPSSPSRELTNGLLAFAIVGSVGAFAGICTIIYCLWTGVCFGKKKVHNSVQPTITRAGSNGGTTSNNSGLISRSSTIRRQSSRAMRRQRSGTSSKHADRAEEFSLTELAAATNDFSLENKIGAGSFGVVYRGKLVDGREVAIKRGETGQKTKKFQEKESAFESELAFLSRLHHKHLVRLVGYCEDGDERLLVYEYMKNGAFDDNGGTPTSIVDFAVPRIMSSELVKVLDPRVGPLELNEAEAVELVAYTALHCVNLEGKDRPTMTDIVANLERALSLCDGSHGSISSGTISIVSE
ncbi:hypothetical protein GH714_037170 [Hevea brasiliensis]|uniref:non-specific serine/threonine protein kinase n=1 Tax=Hevea brasiliensis TaxID=3981 RepID=A0A6A6L887_HEVBR|nr:hypothetical protein GH714_037170 [Hevea brasiliensis]